MALKSYVQTSFLIAALLLAVATAAPAFAQFTTISPDGNGGYFAVTNDFNGPATYTGIHPDGNGGYVAETNRFGAPEPAYAPYPDSVIVDNFEDQDREAESLARDNREAEREARADRRAADASLQSTVRQQLSEQRELAAEERDLAAQPVSSMNYVRRGATAPFIRWAARPVPQGRRASQRKPATRYQTLTPRQWAEKKAADRRQMRQMIQNGSLSGDPAHEGRAPSAARSATPDDPIDRAVRQMMQDGSLPDQAPRAPAPEK